jgi:plasmid stabilization system protein ParE
MSRQLVFLPEAREEFDRAADWYEGRQTGLGTRFTLAINAALERIAKNPKMHAVVLYDARKAVVSGFPYCGYSRGEGDDVIVLSAFHTSRDPAEWHGRV